MTQSRQLAAILFTDIVGYTALMGADEHRAFEILNKNRQIHKPLIKEYRGKWIKEIGDGVLASFPAVTDAITCACKILHECSSIPGLDLRIGIHLGEVLFEDGDVFGDGVNIAARLQAGAPIGRIWVSEVVHNNVSNRKEIVTRFVKEETLKNVREPLRIYEVSMEHPYGQDQSINSAKRGHFSNMPEKSIAVLPFVNLSNDPEQEYFSDGMAEEILNSLSHLRDLKVAGRTSSFQFKGKHIDLREVGEKLNVSTVLEGSVRKQGNQLRVTAQLINTENGFNLWSERYDRTMENIFAIQDEIALAITENLKIILFDGEKQKIVKDPTKNKEVYELYLKGRYFWNKRGAFLKKGLEYFSQVTLMDPEFGLAFAGMADSYALLSFYEILPPHEAMPKAKAAAVAAAPGKASDGDWETF